MKTFFAFIFLTAFVGGVAFAETQVYGDYNRGCLAGAEELPESGTGFQSTRRGRALHFGHPRTLAAVAALGQKIHDNGLGVLLIGNLSKPSGGPLFEHSISHQNGLDFDVAYKIAAKNLTIKSRESFEFDSVLSSDQKAVDPKKWDDTILDALRLTAEMPEVERILVHPVIKKELCQKRKHEDWFAKIRPWWKHDNHFHVRLKCPADSKTCVAQDPPPAEIGCDGAAFEWWFSEEAELMRKGKIKKPAGKTQTPAYPPECRDILKLAD